MTYLHEYTILDDNIKVEYTFSSVSESIKVIDMWVDDKAHSVNWMSEEGKAKLMTRLEDDFTNRICGTTDDESYIYDHSIDTIDPDEPTDLPGGEESYVDSLLTTGFDNEPTETEWLEQKAELAVGI
jgi:hypothetical protein|tara:strand:- start:89 stop:469 length:381 start_codon:yes stop_codon:yes gene_type:complete